VRRRENNYWVSTTIFAPAAGRRPEDTSARLPGSWVPAIAMATSDNAGVVIAAEIDSR